VFTGACSVQYRRPPLRYSSTRGQACRDHHPYLEPLTRQVADYIEAAGTEVVDALSLEVSDNLAVANLDPDDLREHWKKLDITNADAIVLSACVQMPSLSAIPAVEEQSGLPVLTAATATTYAVLAALNLEPTVRGPPARNLRGRQVCQVPVVRHDAQFVRKPSSLGRRSGQVKLTTA
jgi:hypothetical protein